MNEPFLNPFRDHPFPHPDHEQAQRIRQRLASEAQDLSRWTRRLSDVDALMLASHGLYVTAETIESFDSALERAKQALDGREVRNG